MWGIFVEYVWDIGTMPDMMGLSRISNIVLAKLYRTSYKYQSTIVIIDLINTHVNYVNRIPFGSTRINTCTPSRKEK